MSALSGYLAKKQNKMEIEKQNNYYVANQFQANAFFLHPLKTGKERKHWLICAKMG